MCFNLDMSKKNEHAEFLRKQREALGMSMTIFAERLGVQRSRYKNWEYGLVEKVPQDVLDRVRELRAAVTEPRIPASQLQIPVPYIGRVAASSACDWTNPLDCEEFEFVPPEMGDGKGRFACRVIGDSMYDLLIPDDICVFQASDIPKLGVVVLHRSPDNLITVKELKHDGERYILHSLNAAYTDQPATGVMVGYLIGIVRERGSRKTTEYDASGIRP
jgi:SOS-response transcriptional repressor LexA